MELALEPAFELDEIPVPEREEPAVEPADEEPEERKAPAKRQNLGNALILQAIQDYREGSGLDHKSASQFLFPTTAAYRKHFSWAIGLSSLDEGHTRRRLDELRRVWNANREKRS
jgi:hypothetical protein